MMIKHTRKHHKKIIVIVLVLVFLAAAGTAFAIWNSKDSGDSSKPKTDDTGINYNPPTDDEKQAGEDQKDNNAKPPADPEPEQPSGKKEVSVVISDAGQYDDTIEVRAFVPSYIQNGTCTVTITKDSHKITKTANAYADASSSICTNPEILRSEFPVSGEWSVTVAYDSAGAHGESAIKKITIQ